MIKLQKFEEKDIEQFISWIKNERFLLQISGNDYKMPFLKEQLLKQINDASKNKPSSLLYKVINTQNKEVIGHIQLVNIDWDKRIARVGRVLIGEKNMRGKGIGTKMIKDILKIAFDELNLQKVTINVYDFNLPAIKCYEKIGFKKISKMENAVKYKDESWNLIKMEISK